LGKNERYFTWRPISIFDHMYLAQFFWEWEMFQTYVSCRENQNTHFMFNNFFLNRAIHEIMGKDVEWGRLQMTVWRMHISCWVPKATNTHTWNM
jgi:hypothetical protein